MEYLIIISIICIIIAIICVIKLQNKQHLDIKAKQAYERDVALLQHRKNTLQEDIDFCEKQIAREQERFERVQKDHNETLAQQSRELDNFYEKSKARRMEQLENEMLSQEIKAKELLQKNIQEETNRCNVEIANAQAHLQQVKTEFDNELLELVRETTFQHEKFESLLAPLQQYEKEKLDKLFYTVQIPEEYHNDIDYLLTTVSQQIQHPDIVNKLVWSEYVKPYLDETFKRIEIEAKPGIYKITNIDTSKAYIGKSTDIKKRISDHYKGACKIRSIADQAIHHAMLEEGLWNWSIECITYCEKEQLNELEKYYIDFFKTQQFGFNKNSGGGG